MKLNRRYSPTPEPEPETALAVRVRNRNQVFLSEDVVMSKVEFIALLTSLGMGRKDIAEYFGFDVGRLDRMTQRYPELREAIEQARSIADMKVVNALFRRCVGYNYVEMIYDKYGNDVKQVFKHLPPDVTACIFWLKNRMKDEWADTYRGELTLKDRMDLGYKSSQGG